MMFERHLGLIAAVLAVGVLVSASAQGADQWSQPYPGIDQLYRTLPGQRIHAAVVDISRPELYIRATRPSERGRTTTSFAHEVGAAVAINGDWGGSSFEPTGLAVGAGEHWPGTTDQGWSFIACTLEKECLFDDHTVDRELNSRWHEVVGGNGWRLLIDGQIPTYPSDSFYHTRHPRSAVGMTQDGNTLIFMVVQGRRSDSSGMTFREIAEQLQSLGAHQGMMLDGGGSSALVIGGSRVSALPSGASERVVTNHLAIVGGIADARCSATPNGRYCDGSVIHTCRGGQHMGEGDCGAFGASCEITADGVGVCSHYKCKNGPNGTFCDDDTTLGTCEYGQPSYGDCAAYGASCEESGGEGYCVHFECSEGGNATWCKDSTTLASCTRGTPGDDVDCAASGQVCSDGACVARPCPDCDAGQTEDADAAPEADAQAPDASGESDTHPEDTDVLPFDASHPDDASGVQLDATASAGNAATSTGSCACETAASSLPGGATAVAVLLLFGAAAYRRREPM